MAGVAVTSEMRERTDLPLDGRGWPVWVENGHHLSSQLGPGDIKNGTYPYLMEDGNAGSETVPGLAPDSAVKRGRLLYTLDVDGEVFTVRTHDGGTDYSWVNGPNKDYGFGTSAKNMPEEAHRANIRNLLEMIDPATGFIGDD